MKEASETDNYRKTFDLCVNKSRRNIKLLADEPKSWAFDQEGIYSNFHEGFFDIGNWTSSFFTGMALISYRQTKDNYFLEQLNRLAAVYHEKVFVQYMETMHDLGFLYSLYSVALYKETGDQNHRKTGLRAAEVLASRFQEKGNYIRAWGRLDEPETDYAGLAIIDCLMNLPLLFWAAEETGDRKYYEISVKHADTVLKNMVREDFSVHHSLRFDPETGEVKGEDNYCGNAVGSEWARGTAWAIYGFALLYKHTKDEKYLDVSEQIALHFAEKLRKDGIPVWDFKMLDGDNFQLDTSAASPAVCGLIELERHGIENAQLKAAKIQMLDALTNGEYLNFDENINGILKQAEVGNGVGKARYAFTSWGDYYLMEALDRFLNNGETWW